MEPQSESPLLDLKTFGRTVFGYQEGYEPTDAELKQVQDAHNYYVKEELAARKAKAAVPKYMSLTNADGRVVDVIEKGDGTLQVIEPKFHNTRQGIVSMVNPTNAVPVTDPTTGKPYQGYAADFIEEGDTPKFGQTNATTVATTNAPTPPAFDPTTLTNAAMIRDALHSGKIPDEQTALQLIKSLGSR